MLTWKIKAKRETKTGKVMLVKENEITSNHKRRPKKRKGGKVKPLEVQETSKRRHKI